MKRRKLANAICVAVCLAVTVAAAACAKKENKPADASGNVGDESGFLKSMDTDFYVQDGTFFYLDTIELASQKKLISCFGNNAGSGYFVPLLPPAPNQDPAEAVKTEVFDWPKEEPSVYYNADEETFPQNPYFSPIGWNYKLRADEAVVLIGELPPECAYYSFINYIFASPVKEGKEYTQRSFFTFGDQTSGIYHPIFASMGSPVNQFNVKHGGDSAFGSEFVYIASGSKDTYEAIKDELTKNGYDEKLINEAPFPAQSLHMGLDQNGDLFDILMRLSQPVNEEDYNDWVENLSSKIHAYRVTPREENTSNLYANAALRERGTGIHEVETVPNAAQALDEIRANLIAQYADSYTYEELDSRIAVPEGMTGYLNDENAQGDNRDTSYLMTDDFEIKSDDDFVVVYGVNHKMTGKCVYANTVLYSRPMLNGIVSVYDGDYEGSADAYLDKDTKNREYFYTLKMARKELDEYTKVIPYSTGNENGKYYGADNNTQLLLAYRAYVEPETEVGPSYYEIVYDRAIVFHKK